MKNNIALLLALLFFVLLTVFNLSVPFFWDGTFFSEAALSFFENNFNSLIPPLRVDTGGFPMYSMYLAFVWKLFGKTLAVSHLALLPFLLIIVFEYYTLAKRFLEESIIPFALLLLVAEPVFVTQSILMGYDCLLVCFFFIALNAIFSEKINKYRIALLFLILCNVRGIIFVFALIIIELLKTHSESKKIKINLLYYLLAFLGISIWSVFHYYQTRWILFSPLRENNHETMVSAGMMFNQLLYIIFKLNDFGRIFLWMFIVGAGFYNHKKTKNSSIHLLTKILFVTIILLSLLMILLANPISHKYFILVFLLLNISCCFSIQQIKKKYLKVVFSLVLMLALVLGNFWIYPTKYGNGWDSSLKVLPYFALKKEMDNFIKSEKINANDVGTQFPLIADTKYSQLTDSSYCYENVWQGPLTKFHYILYTNVINTDISEQFEEVKNNWKLLKKLKGGMTCISLYENKSRLTIAN